jgi:subtilisin family serine protease
VAGVAALIRSVSPDLGPAEVRGIIESTADKVGVGREPYFLGRNDSLGHGRVNALAAVEMARRERS